MANPTTNYGFVLPTPTDLVTDLPADFDVALQGVDTQMLTNANAAIAKTIVDAKGDIIAATGADAVSRLAVGANATVLTADSTTATGLKWAAAAASGKVLQVVAAYTTTQTANSTATYADTTLTATITPTLNTSKILVILSQNGVYKNAANLSNGVALRLLRGATQLDIFNAALGATFSALANSVACSFEYLDSPATTSATTYKTQFQNPANVAQVAVQVTSSSILSKSSIILMEIGA